MPYNLLCMFPDFRQGKPGSGDCTVNTFLDGNDSSNASRGNCLTATDIVSGRDPKINGLEPQRTRGSGCKNDGGPLWITVELVDEENGVAGASGGGDVPRTVYGRIFQKKSSNTSSRRSKRGSRYAQIES